MYAREEPFVQFGPACLAHPMACRQVRKFVTRAFAPSVFTDDADSDDFHKLPPSKTTPTICHALQTSTEIDRSLSRRYPHLGQPNNDVCDTILEATASHMNISLVSFHLF